MGKTAEFKTVVTLLVGLFILISASRFQEFIYIFYNPENFLSLHILLELFSVSVAFAIILQGWMIFPHNLSLHRLLVATLFLSVCIFDTLHTLTYKGMPFFLTDNSVQTATWFWIFARLTVSIGVLIVCLLKDRNINEKMRYAFFSISFFCTIIVSSIIFMTPSILPPLVIEGVRLTTLKVILEYLIVILLSISILKIFYRYRKKKSTALLALISAIGFGILSDLVFIVYNGIYDFDNLLAHFFKVISYAFLLKGIYSQTIEVPFSRQKKTQKALSESEKRLNTIVSLVPTGIIISDKDGHFTYANKAAREIYGEKVEILNAEQIDNKGWEVKTLEGDVFPKTEYNISVVQRTKKEIKNVIYKIYRKNKETKTLSVSSAPILDEHNQVVQIINSISDITELMKVQEENHYLAFHDELTGLQNRNYFKERLKKCFHKTNEEKEIAILLIGVNRFKNINDSLGNEMGDLFLQKIAARLMEFFKPTSKTVARIGSDEFSILIEGERDFNAIIGMVNSIVDYLQQPIKLKGFTFYIDVTIGISTYTKDVTDEEQLLQQAYIAMHEAKKLTQAYMSYTPDMNVERLENIILENELRNAITRNELTLFYQPQLNVHTGEIIGIEALIRWIHPEKGMISPGKFIPIAEESGLIVPIGKWVLHEACKQLKEWHEQVHNNMSVSVNLSSRQFFQDDLVDTIKAALKQAKLDPNYLVLEITESLTMDIERTLPMLNSLKDLGIQIAIDDFGTGYSSFNYLHQLPIDQLKIDQSFIRNLSTNVNNEAIVQTIITLAHHLKLDLTAEGVETKAQLNFLKRHQCYSIQGFLFSKPLPTHEVEVLFRNKAWLRQWGFSEPHEVKVPTLS